MPTTMEVAQKLVELCRAGKNMDAMTTLYSPHIVCVEAASMPGMPARMEGIAAIKAKSETWMKNHEIHKAEVQGPWPHGDRFICRFTYDLTAKAGPMAGKRMTMDEAALYTVADGKIVREEFFYNMG